VVVLALWQITQILCKWVETEVLVVVELEQTFLALVEAE
jgi:hypothetical protein